MKPKQSKAIKRETLREQILKSMRASFKIEGIDIPQELANAALKKIELSLGK